MKKALITGITGQDGGYLARLLLGNGYKVYGGVRRISTPNFWRLDELGIKSEITLVDLDITDQANITRLISDISPDEIYNLAAQSFVAASFKSPLLTSEVTGLGVVKMLEGIRAVNPSIKFYQASSSEMFGEVQETPQTELTPFYPRSPYGVSKLYGHWITVNYREAFGMFACSGILFNHESEMRGLEFITRKVTDAIAKIKFGKLDCLTVGNIDSKRDWGHAVDYVEAMWQMLQHNVPDTYIVATNETHSVREFIELSFKYAGINIRWEGKGIDEIGIDNAKERTIVRISPEFFRPAEVNMLIGDYSKAKAKLGWKPKVRFEQLVELMINKDIERQAR
jgi:GDPmannose 4,6-dehydratase